MKIPFTKAHGARNDFLLSWSHDVPPTGHRAIAKAICDRYSGVGADGWMIVTPPQDPATHAAIQLYNSDGSDSEISGNGTRCAAAFLIDSGVDSSEIRIATGAGVKFLRPMERQGAHYVLEMNMGRPQILELRSTLEIEGRTLDVTILNVGNPQCVVFVDDFPADWRTLGRAIEWHPRFPNRTNVSFVKALDRHRVDVLFWERGAGETMSSGTGSTGAAAAAVARDLATSPVAVLTPAGTLPLRWQSDDIYLTGPADLICRGQFFWESE